ncbi:hypothetical protein D3C73_577460 [compost metagenome]
MLVQVKLVEQRAKVLLELWLGADLLGSKGEDPIKVRLGEEAVEVKRGEDPIKVKLVRD